MYDTPVELCATQHPNASVIWLHGLGADGNDFVPVIDMLNLPNIRFVLPHAPYRAVTLNNGYEMRAWYDLYGMTLDNREDESGIRESQRYVETLIEREVSRGIPYHRIVLAGFSQGGAIALHTALRFTQSLAGVLALSTYLPLKSLLVDEKSAQNQPIPILMAHGDEDTVITTATARVSYETLKAAHYDVSWLTYPMAHSVCIEEIKDIRHFLSRIIVD
jgi:phospholipase/carboxylesterase